MKVIVTVKVKLSMSEKDSMEFHNGLFTNENIGYFKSIGNIGHSANLSANNDGYLIAIDTWEVANLDSVEAFYSSEQFKENMAAKFSSKAPEVNIWVQEPNWVTFSQLK